MNFANSNLQSFASAVKSTVSLQTRQLETRWMRIAPLSMSRQPVSLELDVAVAQNIKLRYSKEHQRRRRLQQNGL